MTFADTGSGISRDHLKHIFEPFFTTKEDYGTGLGLWVTNDIVKRHGGKLRVRSRPAQGTVFSVMLPEARGSRSCSEEDLDATSAHSGRGRS
jgi:signal transduction histidine kinase